MNKIVLCKYCGKPEYWGDMRWLSGKCMCRNCYKVEYEQERNELYMWDDLDGKRPTIEEYENEREQQKSD